MDEVRKMLLTRIISFDTEISFKEKIMPTLAKADVREWAEPYYLKGKEEAWEESKIDDAKKMLTENLDIDLVCKITSLSRRKVLQLKRNLS